MNQAEKLSCGCIVKKEAIVFQCDRHWVMFQAGKIKVKEIFFGPQALRILKDQTKDDKR